MPSVEAEWAADQHAGVNKGEARNTLTTAVFFNRLGEMRDRRFKSQRYRASGRCGDVCEWTKRHAWRACALTSLMRRDSKACEPRPPAPLSSPCVQQSF
jgi:hypothetical protein